MFPALGYSVLAQKRHRGFLFRDSEMISVQTWQGTVDGNTGLVGETVMIFTQSHKANLLNLMLNILQ